MVQGQGCGTNDSIRYLKGTETGTRVCSEELQRVLMCWWRQVRPRAWLGRFRVMARAGGYPSTMSSQGLGYRTYFFVISWFSTAMLNNIRLLDDVDATAFNAGSAMGPRSRRATDDGVPDATNVFQPPDTVRGELVRLVERALRRRSVNSLLQTGEIRSDLMRRRGRKTAGTTSRCQLLRPCLLFSRRHQLPRKAAIRPTWQLSPRRLYCYP